MRQDSNLALAVGKNPPAIQGTWVQALSQEDPLEEEMATHSSILAWRIPRTEEPGGLQTMGPAKESGTPEPLRQLAVTNPERFSRPRCDSSSLPGFSPWMS